jgi:transportin-1
VEVLREFTPKLIPMLLTNMAYAEDDEEVLVAEDEDDEEGYGDDDDDPAQWNLRKSSANGLDVMSNLFGDELLGMILPIVEQRLREPNWRLRESAILAIGAVSEGCTAGMDAHSKLTHQPTNPLTVSLIRLTLN